MSVKVSGLDMSERKNSFNSKLEDYFPKSKYDYQAQQSRPTQDSRMSSGENLVDLGRPSTFGRPKPSTPKKSIAEKLKSADFNCFKKIQMKNDFKALGLEYQSENKNTRSTGSFLVEADLKKRSPSAQKLTSNLPEKIDNTLSGPVLPFNIPNFMNNFDRNSKNAGERIHSNLDLNISSNKKRRLIYSTDQPVVNYSPLKFESVLGGKFVGLSPQKNQETNNKSYENDFLKSYYTKLNVLKENTMARDNRGKSAVVKRTFDRITDNGLDGKRKKQVVLESSGLGALSSPISGRRDTETKENSQFGKMLRTWQVIFCSL